MLQRVLFGPDKDEIAEDVNSSYLTEQIINMNGRKNKLLSFINDPVLDIKEKLGKKKLDILDGFSGSGIVSRLLKQHSNKLYVNDMEHFPSVLNKCHLANKKSVKGGSKN